MKVNFFRQSDKNIDLLLEKLDKNIYDQYVDLLNTHVEHNNGLYDVLISEEYEITAIILWDGWNGEFIDMCLQNMKEGNV
jgi:phosphoenolpyruvate carboxylase